MLWRFLNRLFGRSDIYIDPKTPYMRRWRIGFKLSPGVRLHNILRSDLDRELHDHPFAFLTIILAGGYYEYRPVSGLWAPDGLPIVERKWHGPGSILFRRSTDLHRLELKRDEAGRELPAWTFVFRTRYARDWGFLTVRGWVPWWRFMEAREGRGEKAGEYAAPSSL